MNPLDWIKQAKDQGVTAFNQATEALGAGAGYVTSAIGQTRLFGSTETSASYDDSQVDEKHYFLVPDRRAEVGYSLYVMRCLPDGVPPINDLPKRRLFHLPNEHAAPTVEHILLSDARGAAEDEPASTTAIAPRLNEVADQIDRLDGKVFGGVLLIGGLVALANPIAGAAIAAKALVPSLGLMLSKHGLKYVGDVASSRDAAARVKKAEKEVLSQFHDSRTESVVNPLLAQLDHALETNEDEYDPILEFDVDSMTFGERDRDRLIRLTCRAITNTYEELLGNPKLWGAACLGPEDIRYLKLLGEFARDTPA